MRTINKRNWQAGLIDYLIWRADEYLTEDDAVLVKARDCWTAARDWAEWNDANSDYSIEKGNNATIFVKMVGSETLKIIVSCEPVPNYTVRVANPQSEEI